MTKGIFSWSADTYKIQALESIAGSANKDDWAAIKAEYTRLRDIAHKRIQRLGKSQFNDSQTYLNRKGDFPKLRDLRQSQIPTALADLAKFLMAKSSTVSGQRAQMQKTIKNWQEHGLNLNESNYKDVMKLMREMRIRKLLYGSDKVMSVVQNVQAKGFDINQIINSPKLASILKAPSKIKKIPKKKGADIDSYFK